MDFYKEVWSANDEDFNSICLVDLLDDNPELKVGDVVWKAEAKHPKVSNLIDVDDILELLADRAYDIGGEWSEDWMSDVESLHRESLQAALEKWCQELPEVNFYLVCKSVEYVITEQDLEE